MHFVLRLLARLPVGPVSRRALDELAADWHHERHAPRDPSRAPRPAPRATLRTHASAGLALAAGAARVV
ncbi:MAG TPA: hypothetical protein VLL94_06625, partial [Nitrospiraceae bacterium]|nr:hypothetical protein [Nitrospiraceae bacterium]